MITLNPRIKVGVLVALLVVLNAAIAFSQVVTGSILGRITDSTGAVVPGATVQIQNVDTGFSQTVQSDSEGRYLARNLPLGAYTVTVQQAGFQSQVHRGISLSVGSEVAVNVELAVGNVQEKVEVTAEAPMIETTNATVSGLVSPEQIRELPLNGRSYDSLALLSPGVFANRAANASTSEGMGTKISVDGGRPDANLYLLDGTITNDQASNGPGSAAGTNLGVEGIREFRMLTHNFSAEYGRNSGAVLSAVTRSGTNDFHGSVYEFVRNNIFDARNFFSQGDLAPFRRNQFGGALGGRIIRDRMFFFVNYEGLRERQGLAGVSFVPDLNARKGLLPNPTTGQLQQAVVNPAALPYVNLYPLPNGRVFGDGTAEFFSAPSVKTTEDYSMERMDIRLRDNDNFYWRYVYDPSEKVTPSIDSLFADTGRNVSHFVIMSETHIFSGASLNEFRFSFNRTDPVLDSLPAVTIDPSLSFVPGQTFGAIAFGGLLANTAAQQLTGIGANRVAPQFFPQNLFQLSDSFSTVRGAHSLKFGADFDRPDLNIFQGSYARGSYFFGGIQDLLAGNPTRLSILLLNNQSAQSRGWRRIVFGWFVQDDYRLRPNLTLNLGLRHEFFTNPTEVNGRSSNLRNVTDPANTPGLPFTSPYTNFSPRFGLAWDPTSKGKTSIRLGAGMYYNFLDARGWAHQANNNADFLKSYTLNFTPTSRNIFPNATLALQTFGLVGAQVDRSIEYKLDTPTVIHYSLDIQHQLAPSLSVRAGYVGSHGYHMSNLYSSNIKIPTILPDGSKFWSATAPFTNPNFSEVERLQTKGTYNYNALQMAVNKSMSAGLTLQVSYTYSKSLSDSDETRNSIARSIPPVSLDGTNLAREYSLSAYDQRHTFVVNGSYQMPWEKHLSGRLAKATLGGWGINGIFSYGSGLPGDPTLGFNNSRNADPYVPDRPNLAAGAKANPTDGVTAGCQGIPAGQKLRTPDRWFDPCAFDLPAAGFLGSLGRLTVTMPGTSNVDFTIVKTTSLTEQKKLQFRAEFFNLFNHANFGLPILTLFNSSRGRSGNAGRPVDTNIANRQLQLGMKLIF
jgi:carboxypeptidase family protein/TonB-dependent receptor-like protein